MCGCVYTDILTVTAATTIVDSVPSCIPQWSGWVPKEMDTSEILLDCFEASGS